MPDELDVNGVRYLRADLARAEPEVERTLSIGEASEATGFPRDVIYAATKRGELPAVMPNGTLRGARIRVSALAATDARPPRGRRPCKGARLECSRWTGRQWTGRWRWASPRGFSAARGR